jgi:hypothetical protein
MCVCLVKTTKKKKLCVSVKPCVRLVRLRVVYAGVVSGVAGRAHEAGHEERVGSHRLSAPDVGLLLSVARGVSRRTRRHGRRHPLGGVVEAVCESQVLTKTQ